MIFQGYPKKNSFSPIWDGDYLNGISHSENKKS